VVNLCTSMFLLRVIIHSCKGSLFYIFGTKTEFMKSSLLSNTASLAIVPLRWLSFSQVATASYVPLAASFTPGKLTVIAQAGTSYYPALLYRFTQTSGVLPAWVQPGVGINLKASVTVSSRSLDLSSYYVVRSVDTVGGTYFDVDAPRSHEARSAVAFTQTLTVTNLDSGSGVVTVPLVSLIMQAQKAMFAASSGSVILAPAVDLTGAAPYSITLTSGGAEYEVSSQPCSKYDLSDWSVKWSTAGTLAVRFL